MAPRKQVILRGNDQNKGFRVLRTPYFVIKYLKNSLSISRISVIISATTIPLAVKRNFIRRQVKKIFLERSSNSYDFIVVIHKAFAILSKKQINEQLYKIHHDLSL